MSIKNIVVINKCLQICILLFFYTVFVNRDALKLSRVNRCNKKLLSLNTNSSLGTSISVIYLI